MLPSASPFVLLDDARTGGTTRLYADPVRVVAAMALDEIPCALETLRTARADGLHAAGYLHYDAAPAFNPRMAPPLPGESPLLWFGLFAGYQAIDDVMAMLPEQEGGWAGVPCPIISRAAYTQAFSDIAELIRDGEIYQANLTFRSTVAMAGDPAAIYAAIRARAAAGYGALIRTETEWVLSFSPELFFALEGNQLTAKPMKGTAKRGATRAVDVSIAAALRDDLKQRAENLMIVDLMRNDLSRVAVPGSVAVPHLFTVETYPTIHTLTSTITATLQPGFDAVDALAALFPCGSVIGAPKLRAMAAIAATEGDARGLYTGSIGRLDAEGGAMFNVAIRTLVLPHGSGSAKLGLGSGVVADSNAADEWEECLAKGAFVTAGTSPFDLIETMAFDPEGGVALLERHLARMKASAELFGYPFDRHGLRNELQAATFKLRHPSRIRLLLSPSGASAIGVSPLPDAPLEPVSVQIAPLPVAASDFRLRHKTSNRNFYDRARHASDAFETIFVDANGFLTEGSFTSIFVEKEGRLVTPPLSRGLLPGVLRSELIESGRAIEDDLLPADLQHGFWIGNAVRGLISAVTVAEFDSTGL